MQADLLSGPARLLPCFCGMLGISSLPKVQYNEKKPISHLCQGHTPVRQAEREGREDLTQGPPPAAAAACALLQPQRPGHFL